MFVRNTMHCLSYPHNLITVSFLFRLLVITKLSHRDQYKHYDPLMPLTWCTTCNKTTITILSYFMSISFAYSRKSAENKSATNPPQKYSAGQNPPKNSIGRPNGRKKFGWRSIIYTCILKTKHFLYGERECLTLSLPLCAHSVWCYRKVLWLIDCICVWYAGWLYDISDSYDNSFYMMGACIIVSGAMLYPIPFIQRWRLRHEKEIPETNQEEQMALKPVTA